MYSYLKRCFDFIIASTALILLLPLFVTIFFCLLILNNGKPLFFQERIGKNEHAFKIIKFRTMSDRKDKNGILLPDNERLTPVGSFIRKTSLDEIPQLINVVKGDMSLVGPRPLLPEYLPLYSEQHRRRHEVRPGITGLAQVKGRNTMKFSERFKNDIYYVDNCSFFLDLKIILMTFRSVFFRSSDVVHGQTVDEVDDVGVSKNLTANHFRIKKQ